LNLVIDESTNISNNRIINTSTITNNGNCFYILNIKVELSKLKAEELVDKAVDIAKKITKEDLPKVVSWTIDTCVIMWSM
jgi:ferredoxin-fold anticodon binding domain-containing protein